MESNRLPMSYDREGDLRDCNRGADHPVPWGLTSNFYAFIFDDNQLATALPDFGCESCEHDQLIKIDKLV